NLKYENVQGSIYTLDSNNFKEKTDWKEEVVSAHDEKVLKEEKIENALELLQNLEKERKSNLQPYTYTIYISYAVFIGIAVILSSQFFSEIQVVQDLLKTTNTTGASGGVFSALKDMDLKQLDSILFNMAIVEAVFGGLAAGKIGSGSYVAGIKHIVIMVIIAVIAFNVM
ncbi:MAG: hypothetical protein ACE5RJ_01775, partial [Nitrosopumilaceae archaeon]